MRLSNPDLKALQVFRSVVENHGFRGAQLALNVSPSVVSTYMKALEQRLGFQVCQRGKGGFRLTDKGRAVYESLKKLDGALDAFELSIGELRDTLSGRLRVGLSANTVTDDQLRIYEVIRSFGERGYDVFFDIVVLPTELLERGLVNGEYQIAIAPFVNQLDILRYEKLYNERHRMYCSWRHSFFDREDASIPLTEVADQRFVTRAYMHQNDLAHLTGARAAASVSSMEAQLIMILSGYYIGYLADHYAAPWVSRGMLRELSHKELEFSLQFYLATQRNQPNSLVFRTFTDDLIRQLQPNWRDASSALTPHEI